MILIKKKEDQMMTKHLTSDLKKLGKNEVLIGMSMKFGYFCVTTMSQRIYKCLNVNAVK
jgi:hypothetical protein